jgi:phenylalanyl-tRNA synthetase beta chain
MKFTFNWLKEHLDTDATLDQVVEKLSMIGLEVEGVEDRARDLAPFVIAHVKEAAPHPNADRLRVCTVDTGAEVFEVVCGAPNARTGLKGVFAPEGTHIPGTGITLTKAKIRGVESSGMLCSEREMGLSDDHEGIIELPEDAPVGEKWAAWAGLDDAVIDIALTPNRGDCAAVRGVARDLAAAGLGTLKPLKDEPVAGAFESPVKWKRDFPAGKEDACPMVVGRFFRGVKNGPSPQWLQDRLRAIGLRPISALVDITNWATFDLGRPLHVFDAGAIAGDLTMRLAKPGETIGALDGKDYTLDGETVVIADQDGVQAIGGIMGGEGAGCGDDTTDVFLEVALFDPARIAESGRKLGIISDARYRFERGMDPQSAVWGVEIATRMILDLCGGEASELTIAGEMPAYEREQAMRLSRLLGLGGLAVPKAEAARILDTLGFETREDGEVLRAKVPSWRPDIDGEADLVEEVLRIFGYDAIPPVRMERETAIPQPVRNTAQNRAELARRTLATRGLMEAVTYSFMDSRQAALFGGVADSLRVDNPISAELDVMRPSILPNLIDAARRNMARGFTDAGLFEVGPQYATDKSEGQALVAAGLRFGQAGPRHWSGKPRGVDAFDAKADALAALAAANAPVDNLQITRDAPGWYHPGRSGALRLGPNVLAHFGEVHPATLRGMDADAPMAAFEVYLENVPMPKAKQGPARPLLKLPQFQPVRRDFAFVVASEVEAGAVMRAARGAERTLITDVQLFDVFKGASLGEGKKSLAVTVTLQPVDATMTDEQINAVADKIVAAVKKSTGGELRG